MRFSIDDAPPAWRIVLLLCGLAVLPYLNALGAGFTFDDAGAIRQNPAVIGGFDPVGIFATPLFGTLYRPLTILTFALNEAWAPGNAAAFHAVNLVLHVVVTLLVFLLARCLCDSWRVGALAAALFALHPIHTEAVTSLVGRAELLAAAFGLTALVAASHADASPGRRAQTTFRLVSVGAFFLALLSKESALTLLLLIPLFRIACRRELLRRGLWTEMRTWDWLPYTLCAAVFVLLRFIVVNTLGPGFSLTPLDNVLAFVPWTERVPSALGVLWDYFGLLNLPLVLSADYSYDQVPTIAVWSPRALGGLALLTAALLMVWRDRRPMITFAVALPLVALAVTSNVLFPIGTIKAERLLYLPSAGWALLAAYACDHALRTARSRAVTIVALAVVCTAFGARTWARNGDWQDDATLYRSMVRTAPASAKARYNYGVILQARHAQAAAVTQFDRALAIYPFAEAAVGLGIAAESNGATDDAAGWYMHALRIIPTLERAHVNLCYPLLKAQRFAAATAACRNGLRYVPTNLKLLKGLGESLIGAGDCEKGTDLVQRAAARSADRNGMRVRLGGPKTAGGYALDQAGARGHLRGAVLWVNRRVAG